jgi:hypothetical protein
MSSRTAKQQANEKLWRLGHLSHKLHSGQRDLYELYYNAPHKIQTWLIARRFGKTYTLCLLALEQCLKKPNSIVKFVSPTKLQVNNNVRPLFRKILDDCPQDIAPVFNQKDYIYYFPNGSEIQLAGSEGGHAEKLRGGDSHLAFVDEAGSCSDLDNTIKSILLPTTLMTNGKIILASTPPIEPDHEFIHFIEEAEARGSLIKRIIYDNPLLTEEQIKDAFDELGGPNTEEARREYLCEVIRDPKTSVIPEFTKDLEAEVVMDWKKPPHYDMFEAMDLGYKDLTVCLLGYYDFRNNKVVIEDEVVIDFKLKDTTIETLVREIKDKEAAHFFNHLTNEQKEPTKRISDIEYIVINEIKKVSNYKMNFETVKKDNLDAMVNFLREKLKKKEMIINPRCVTLIRHLRNIKWKKGEKSMFGRSPNDGHYDAVAALMYLVRSIDYRKNPYPAHYGRDMRDIHVQDEEKFYQKTNIEIYKKLFNIRKK